VKEGAQIKRSKSGMSDNDRFFNENTRALATAKIGPKHEGNQLPLAGFLKPEPGSRCGCFFFSSGADRTRKKCYNKTLDSASELAAYGGRADSSPNILLSDVVRRIFTGGVRG
jgi:hypothetical protein